MGTAESRIVDIWNFHHDPIGGSDDGLRLPVEVHSL